MIIDSDLNLRLLAGIPIDIYGLGSVTPLKIKDVINLGEPDYNELLSVLLIDKSNIEGLEDDEKISNLELSMVYADQDVNFKEKILKALELFLNKEFFVSNEGFFYCKIPIPITDDEEELTDNEEEELFECLILDKEPFDDLQNVLKNAHHIEKKRKEDEIIPGNEQARKFMEKLKLSKQNIKKPEVMNLHSIISGVAWKSNSMNIINIFDLTIYQLYDAFHRLENIDNYHYTLSGIYAGNVDSKNINLSKITWYKILKN